MHNNWQNHLDNLEKHYQPKDFFNGQAHRPTNEPDISEHFFIPTLTEENEFPEEGELNVDIFQDEKNLYVIAPLAGVKPEKIEVHLDSKDVLTIRGEREDGTEMKGKNYLYQACYWGKFSRSIILPTSVKAEQVTAKLENGVLKITLPKAEENQKINIKINNI